MTGSNTSGALRSYAITYIITVIAVFLLAVTLASFGIDLPTGMSVYMPPLIAANVTISTNTIRVPKTGRWALALRFTGVALVLQIIIGALFSGLQMAVTGAMTITVFAGLSPVFWAMAIFFVVVAILISNRLGIGLGSRMLENRDNQG